MKTSNLLKLCIVLTICCFNPAFADSWKDESGKGKDKKRAAQNQHQRNNDSDSYFHRNGYTHLNIPKGHYPPPGKCRIWHPDRPAGHQSPSGDCRQLRNQVPMGAWLIRHPKANPKHIQVDVYDRHSPGTILITGEFDLGGIFVRIAAGR